VAPWVLVDAGETGNLDVAYVLVEELLLTAFSIGGVLTSLLENLPEDAFPGEDPVVVLIEMITGSSRPAVEAAEESDCRIAIALIGAVRDRVLDDLRAASRLAGPGE
jgi:hypothetical protein